ncbi:MAG: type III PLP-dependent enzyme [Pseudomonadota bacterium]
MTQLSESVLARLSVLPSENFDGGLPIFQTVKDALAANTSDSAFAVLYPQSIADMAGRFLDGFPGKTVYAVKANPHPAVLSTLWSAGIRAFDVASIAEIDLIQSLCPDAELYLMNPVKSRQTIRHGYDAGIRHFAFDCTDELQKIVDETSGARDLNLHLRIALPSSTARLPLMEKFGADADEAVDLLRAARSVAARLGAAFHVGSQCHEPDSFVRAIAHVRELIDAADVQVDSLDCGGGFPVDYPGMAPPDLKHFFSAIFSGLTSSGFDGVTVLGEPGRALCAPGGSTLARVELRKGDTLYINDGAYGTLFDAGTFGWRFPVVCHRSTPGGKSDTLKPYRLFGPTCDSLDRMDGPFDLPADIQEGDWIEFGCLGAYGQAMQTRFNGFEIRQTVAVLTPSFGC